MRFVATRLRFFGVGCCVVLALSCHSALRAQVSDSPSTGTPAALAAFRSGQEAFIQGQLDLAEDYFRSAIAASPRFAAAHCASGQTRMAQRRYADAIGPLEQCRSLAQSLALTRFTEQAAQERETEREIQELRESIQRIRRGEIKTAGEMTATKLEERLRKLEEGRQRTSKNIFGVPAEISFTLGTAYLRTSQHEAAERALREAVNDKPQFGEAHNNLAAVYVVMGRWEDAAHQIEMAEKAGFRVSDALKADVAARRRPTPAIAETGTSAVPKPGVDVLNITHSAIQCVPLKTFPRIEARIDPAGSVTAAKVFFRSDPDEGWYSVRLRVAGERYVAVLPRPRSTHPFRYYVEATSPAASTARTPEYMTIVARHLQHCPNWNSVAVSSASGLIVEAPAGSKGRPVPRGFSTRGTIADAGQFEISPGIALAAAALVGGGAASLGLSQSKKEKPGVPPVGEPFVSGPGIAFLGSSPPPGSTLSRSSGSLAIQLRIFSPEGVTGAVITTAFFTQSTLVPCLLLTTRHDLAASQTEIVVVSGPTRLETGCSARFALTRLTVSVARADQRTLFETGQPGIPHIPITFEWGE